METLAKDDESPNPFPPNGLATPEFSGSSWKLNCPLGECGMTLTTRDVGGENRWVFTYTISSTKGQLEIDNLTYLLTNPKTSTLTFECLYKSEITIRSSNFDVHSVDSDGMASQYGSLDSGFTLRNDL